MINLPQLRERLIHAIWETETGSIPRWQSRLLGLLRISHLIMRDIADGQLALRAMSLVYTTLLSIVPLLAISFSVLKGFGVQNQIEPLLMDFLSPMGERGVEITMRIIGFVENMKAGILGSVGFIFLIYTVISLIQKIERSFNYTWHIKQHRSFAQRFSSYLSVILVGPVLIFSALGIMVSLMASEIMQQAVAIGPFNILVESITRLAPYLLIIGAFTFIYIFVPNTRVKFRSALVGGLIAGIAWKTTGWAFGTFLVNSTNYVAIYSAFATLILFMIWLYLSWLILLLGASIAFYHQHPEFVTLRHRNPRLSNRFKERLAIQIVYLICRHYYQRLPLWSLNSLAQHLRLPADVIEDSIAVLEGQGIIIHTGDDRDGYLPAQPPETISLYEVLAVIRYSGDDMQQAQTSHAVNTTIDTLFDKADQSLKKVLAGYTLKDLAVSVESPDKILDNIKPFEVQPSR